jgi:hypothetical protein
MMRAYSQRKRQAATVMAVAWHNPDDLSKLFPDPAPERPATGWWWE